MSKNEIQSLLWQYQHGRSLLPGARCALAPSASLPRERSAMAASAVEASAAADAQSFTGYS